MTGFDPMPESASTPSAIGRQAIVFDMVYAPVETELLAGPSSSACAPIDGLTMLVGQAGAGLRATSSARSRRASTMPSCASCSTR